jgi:hypothetical protein
MQHGPCETNRVTPPGPGVTATAPRLEVPPAQLQHLPPQRLGQLDHLLQRQLRRARRAVADAIYYGQTQSEKIEQGGGGRRKNSKPEGCDGFNDVSLYERTAKRTGYTMCRQRPRHGVPHAARALALQLPGPPAAVPREELEVLRLDLAPLHQLARAVVPAQVHPGA